MLTTKGYLEPFAKILDSNPAEWKRSWEVNVFGVYHVTRAFLTLMLQSTHGLKEIVNLSSIGAHLIMPKGSGYPPGKLAVQRFTEFISVEYPEMLAYGIHPGGVLTDLARGMGKDMESHLIDSPKLAADTMVWLTADRRDWLQGRYVSVTWDMKELEEKRGKIEQDDLLKVRLRVD
jgi:NAD(P)-dependent dehydrogenase (short-subunit alcohol dehydrogenase family)